MERIPVSSWMLLWCAINPQIKTHRWRTRKQARKTDHLLHSSQPIRWQSRRRRTKRWHTNTEKSTQSQHLSKYSGRRQLDHFSASTRQRITIPADKVSHRNCIQLCAVRLHLQSDFSKRRKNYSRHLVQHRHCAQECLAIATAAAAAEAAEAAARHVGACCFGPPRNWCEKRNRQPRTTLRQ